jgi:hypothetical protein
MGRIGFRFPRFSQQQMPEIGAPGGYAHHSDAEGTGSKAAKIDTRLTDSLTASR